MHVRSQRGFTIIEVMIAATLLTLTIAAIANLNTGLARENLANSQKMAINEAGRAMSQVLADDKVCTRNVQATTPIQAYPAPAPPGPARFYATFTAPLMAQFTPPQALATVGQNLPNTAVPLPVTGIYVGQLIDLGPTPNDPSVELYQGEIQVAIGGPTLVHSVRPVAIQKQFFVQGGRITGCGASLKEIVYQPAQGGFISNPPTGSTPSVAMCPAGMMAISGGWVKGALNTVPGCPPQNYAAVIENRYDAGNAANPGSGWAVTLLCQYYMAYAVCYRPSFSRAN